MPRVTVGDCKNYKRCRQFNTELADGYCINCWDKSLDARPGTQARIARELNVSSSQLSYMTNGKRPWKPGLKKQWEKLT